MAGSVRMLFTSVLLALLYVDQGNAAPSPSDARNVGSRHIKHVGRGLAVEIFFPKSEYKVLGEGIPLPPSFARLDGIEDKTTLAVTSELAIESSKVSFTSGYTGEIGEYGYANQVHNDIPILNAVANVGLKDNRIVAFGHSFVDTSKAADSTPTIEVNEVVPKIEEVLDGKRNDIPATLEYLALSDGTVALVHTFQVQNDAAGTWYAAHVDADSGELLSVTDYVAHATYKVLPVNKAVITEGLEIVVDPQDPTSSPIGWHSGSELSGNNGRAFKEGAESGPSSDTLVFNYTYDPSVGPTEGENTNAALTNAFYVLNSVHDVLYQYGFTEAAFNFQSDNFGKGGRGGDAIFLSVQDGLTTNNALFTMVPDGQPPICRMFLWDKTTPNRDGSMENDIIIHELTHGLTSRMTGGGTARCLLTGEAAALGEGWSDAVADWFSHTDSAEVKNFSPGAWATPPGIRRYPYSTSQDTNPLKYSDLGQGGEEHDAGELTDPNVGQRANLLHNVYAALVDADGWSSTARTDPSGTKGNVVWLHLLVDALALQPCGPTFPDARAAWIQADQNRYGGSHKCTLWKAFASRGLGVGAQNGTDSFEVPEDC
ncbi:hypothetical protein AAF712_006625 [Marasmius tenuissimus]|uniref:Extracellular metalloproteinase n=1 Tax=Marasmius tenuissimus TaxID=585030 RepID=A0ABR2ZXB9_9AGAR